MSILKKRISSKSWNSICILESVTYYTVCRWTFPLKDKKSQKLFYPNHYSVLLTYIMVIWENKTQKIKKLHDVTLQKMMCVKGCTNTPLNFFFQTHPSEVFSKRDIGIIRYSYPHLWKKQKAIWDPLWGPATSLGGANEQGHYRSVSSGGAKHTGQRPNPQKMQSWLHFQSKLQEMETELEISLSCGKSTPNINSRGYGMLCSL